MRKIFLSILFVVLVLYPTSYPKTTEAAGITPTMEVTLDSAYQGFNGLWNWKFNIKTTYTPDNTKVAIETYELIKKVSNTEVTIKDNSATYVATNLKSGQAYSIYFTLGSYNPVIKKTYSGTPGSSSQKPQINNFSPTEGKVGDIVTITGNYLGDVKNIFFGAKNADTSKATIGNAEIKVPVPDGAMTGKITVKNTAGETVSSQIFTLASDPVNVDTDKTNSSDDTYTLLAPLPGLKTAPNNIGDYFNIIFRIAIALCAVLAVIMIIIGGIGYMGSESIFGKTESKSRIMAAILGLLIALGAYALLKTINPDLLGGGGVTIKQVSAEIEDEQESVPWNEYTQGSSSNKNCPEGYGDVSTPWGDNQHKKINVCKTILSKTNEMVLAAKKDGLLLTGSGSRSYERQQKHWSDHNCKPPGSTNCSKIVAKPGTSMHESGYAIDFQCDNKPIAKVDPNNKCVVWLSKNAIKYGFKNLPSESWHWSAGPNAGH